MPSSITCSIDWDTNEKRPLATRSLVARGQAVTKIWLPRWDYLPLAVARTGVGLAPGTGWSVAGVGTPRHGVPIQRNRK